MPQDSTPPFLSCQHRSLEEDPVQSHRDHVAQRSWVLHKIPIGRHDHTCRAAVAALGRRLPLPASGTSFMRQHPATTAGTFLMTAAYSYLRPGWDKAFLPSCSLSTALIRHLGRQYSAMAFRHPPLARFGPLRSALASKQVAPVNLQEGQDVRVTSQSIRSMMLGREQSSPCDTTRNPSTDGSLRRATTQFSHRRGIYAREAETFHSSGTPKISQP